MLKPTVIAIPIFALLIAIEAWLMIRENKENFDRRDVWTNIFLGFGSVAFGLVFGIATSLFYIAAYNVSIYQFPINTW